MGLPGEHLYQAAFAAVLAGHEGGQADQALAGQRELAQGLAVGRGDVGPHAQRIAGGIAQRPGIQRLGPVEAEQHVIGEFFHRRRRAAAPQIVRTGQHAQPARAERPRMQARILQRADAQRHVGALLDQVDDAFVAVQLELDLRMARAETGHARHDHVQHERRGRVDAQASGRHLTPRGHLFLGRFGRADDGACMFEEFGPLFGQLQAPRRAPQQRGLQLLLQPREAAAGRRHGQLQVLGRARDRAGVDHGD